ncbi:hypothetical protein WJX72_007640 [[Myrmecia] bisecta]|uniref:Uncharacterized protein n=1 Tax=[Myrmecia] bisecta TaxID=41462 RepID=A0AAW1P8U9_9CHLO
MCPPSQWCDRCDELLHVAPQADVALFLAAVKLMASCHLASLFSARLVKLDIDASTTDLHAALPDVLSVLRRLRTLAITLPRNEEPSAQLMLTLAQLPNLTDLTLHFSKCAGAATLAQLPDPSNLRSLHLRGEVGLKFTNDNLAQLSSLSDQEILHMNGRNARTDQCAHAKVTAPCNRVLTLATLPRFPALTSLELFGFTHIGDVAVRTLCTRLPCLSNLGLCSTYLSHAGIGQVSKLQGLRSLSLEDVPLHYQLGAYFDLLTKPRHCLSNTLRISLSILQ